MKKMTLTNMPLLQSVTKFNNDKHDNDEGEK